MCKGRREGDSVLKSSMDTHYELTGRGAFEADTPTVDCAVHQSKQGRRFVTPFCDKNTDIKAVNDSVQRSYGLRAPLRLQRPRTRPNRTRETRLSRAFSIALGAPESRVRLPSYL